MESQTPAVVDLGPIEGDFATLYADLATIAAHPVSLGSAAAEALAEIARSSAASPSNDVFGRSFQEALYGIMKESTTTDMYGNMTVNVDKRSLVEHGAPVIRDVVAVVQDQVQAFMNGVGTTVAAAASANEPVPPAQSSDGKRPAVKFKLDLMSLFTGLVKDVTDQASKPPKKS